MSTAEEDRLADQEFAFPIDRKEPLTDARHVRDAIAHFDQVEASATPSEEGMEADRGRGQAL